MDLCDRTQCTGCGACRNICPQKCIQYEKDELGVEYANIDQKKCIECGLCNQVCPVLHLPEGNQSTECYSAWSCDEDIRLTGASGGIATEFYCFAAENGVLFAGVEMDADFNAVYALEDKEWGKFRNSKYVYSDTGFIFSKVKRELKSGRKIIFIGLPCQVAGIRNYLKTTKCDTKNLLTIDLVCHGVAPADYLKNHINYLEIKSREKANQAMFRDPAEQTSTYTFSLKNQDGVFYKRKVNRNDRYQEGYHKGIVYRQNCYQCPFANKERMGDITLLDFSGVGKISKCEYDNKDVSCVLINTQQGKQWFGRLCKQRDLYVEKRPINEVYNYEARLHSPTTIPKERAKFVKKYLESQNFEKAMNIAARKLILKNQIKYYLHVEVIKKILAKVLPVAIKNYIKGLLKRN